MRLFDDIEKSDGAIRPGESRFEFLQRSTDPMAVEARLRLERWLGDLPISQRKQFRDRIRLSNNDTHESSVFELLVHAFLVLNNCKILGYESSAGDKNPDFLIQTPKGKTAFVEASIIDGRNADVRLQDNFQWLVQSELNKVPRISCHLMLTFDTPFANTPRMGPIRQKFRTWLSNPQREKQLCISEAGGMFTVVQLVAAQPLFTGPTISCVMPNSIARVISPQHSIRQKIKKKARQLSSCEVPALLALGLPILHRRPETMAASLFGDEIFHFSPETAKITRVTRQENAVLFHKGQPNNTAISGILSFPSTSFADIQDLNIEFWENPWARYKLDSSVFSVPRWLTNHEAGKVRLYGIDSR